MVLTVEKNVHALREATLDDPFDPSLFLECCMRAAGSCTGSMEEARRKALHTEFIRHVDGTTVAETMQLLGDVETRCPTHIVSILRRCGCSASHINTAAAIMIGACVRGRRAFEAILEALCPADEPPLEHTKEALWRACNRLNPDA